MNPYTTNLVTAADAYARTAVASITNGLATTNYVKTIVSATNTANLIITTNLINTSIATATNGLASTNFVNTAIQAATNGLTGGSGGVTTNFVLTSISATNAANLVITTNLIVAATNQLASTNYVNGAVLAGGATTNFVLTSISATNAANLTTTTNLVVAATNNFTTLVYTNPSAILYTSSLPALTNGFVTSAITNGLATINYVNAATNGLVTSSITNGLATTNYVNAATNGLVTSAVTNGLATTNFVIAATNGLVTSSITNGLATTNYVNAATNGLVTSAITNGLATTNYANTITNNFTTLVYTNPSAIVYTSSLPALTNGFVTALVTNGLATTNYANSVTNNFTTIVYSNSTAFRLIDNTNFPGIYVTNSIITTNITTAGTELVLSQTGDTYGATRARLQNRNGVNGILIENAGLNLADNALKSSSGNIATLRLESRGGAGTDLRSTLNYSNEIQGFINTQPLFGIGTNNGTFLIPLLDASGSSALPRTNQLITAAYASTITNGLATTNYVISSIADKTNFPGIYVTNSTFIGYNLAQGHLVTASGNFSSAQGDHTTASATASHAEGGFTVASGAYSHAEGNTATASGDYAHAEGAVSTASGDYAHAEGSGSTASGDYAHAEGSGSMANGYASHAEGSATASGDFSHAEGDSSVASGYAAHAEGYSTTASGLLSHAEGISSTASGAVSHAAGSQAYAAHDYTWVWSDGNDGNTFSSTTNNQFSVYAANGIRLLGGPIYGDGAGITNLANSPKIFYGTNTAIIASTPTNLGDGLAVFGASGAGVFVYPFAVQRGTADPLGRFSGANYREIGVFTTNRLNAPYGGSRASLGISSSEYGELYLASVGGSYIHMITSGGGSASDYILLNPTTGGGSHISGSLDLGYSSSAGGLYSFAQGDTTTASGYASQAEGYVTTASGLYTHAEGLYSVSSGTGAHAEGDSTIASGYTAHAEGYGSTAAGDYSHSEGTYDTTANGYASHAEGGSTTGAAADYAHAEGYLTTASGNYSHSEGYNTTASGKYSHAAGRNATASSSNTWVWSDGAGFGSTTNRQFSVYATNGIRLLGGPIYGNNIVVSNNANIGGNIDVNGTIANSIGNVQISGAPNQNDISYSVNINGGNGYQGYGGGSVNIQGGSEDNGGYGGSVNLWGGDGIDAYGANGGSVYIRGGNVNVDYPTAGNVILSGGTGQSGSSASSITLNGTTTTSQAGTISLTGDIVSNLRVTGNFTNYVSNISTNTAPIYTSSANTGSYNINTIYTGPAQRSMLIGSIIFPASTTTDQGVTIRYTNNAVGYALQIQYAHANSSGIGIYPFTIPLSTNATFQIQTNLGNTVTAIATNVVLWRL